MVETVYFGTIEIHLWEILCLVVLTFFVFFFSYINQKSNIEEKPYYKYFTRGLLLKTAGTIFFVLIYMFYYKTGDTFAYFESAIAMKNLLFSDFHGWAINEFSSVSLDTYDHFNISTGYPLSYMYWDPQTFTVIRVINPILIFTFNSYLLSSVILGWITYSGLWKLYTIFADNYPKYTGILAFAVLFFPSVIFWGSGILKDTITLSCSGWIVYCIYQLFIIKRKKPLLILVLVFTSFLILLIKPYIIFALFPGTLVWIFSDRIRNIRNFAAKALIIPLIIGITFGIGFFALSSLSGLMGKFSINNISTTLTTTSSDLKQDYYNGHSFDLGEVRNTPSGYVSKLPTAIIAGLYRPFLWESGNIVMVLSGLENTLLLYLTFLMFRRSGFRGLFRRLFREPLLFFAFSYAVFFAFAVGLSTSNFGALVRFKIAYLPFFTSILFILSRKTDEEDDEIEEEVEEEEEGPDIYAPGIFRNR